MAILINGTILRRAVPFAAAVFVLAALVLPAGSADAVANVRTFELSGTMEVGGPPALTLPAGSTFTATIDPATGVFGDGQLSIPTFDRGDVTGPQANITLTQLSPAIGVLDPSSGVSTMVVALEVSLEVPLLSATCSLGPIITSSSSANPGGVPFSGTPLRGTVTASGYTVPAVVGVEGSPTCDPTQASAINATLGLPSSATSLSFTVVETTPAPTPEPPTPEPVVPSYTG
jgi:hypothetical protein